MSKCEKAYEELMRGNGITFNSKAEIKELLKYLGEEHGISFWHSNENDVWRSYKENAFIYFETKKDTGKLRMYYSKLGGYGSNRTMIQFNGKKNNLGGW